MSYSKDLRKKVIQYIQNGGSKTNASKIFDVGQRTIYTWLKMLKNNGNLEKKKYIKTKVKINKEDLKRNIEENSDAYLKDRAKEFGVSITAIFSALKRFKITRKKKSKNIKSVMKKKEKNIEKKLKI